MLDDLLSKKIKFWSLASMVCLVFVHGYNLNNRYLQPFTSVDEPLTFNAYIQYFFSNGIFRFRIPLLFVISGYLTTLKFQNTTHKELVKKRSKTIFLPYLIWSIIGFLFTYLLTKFSYTNKFVVTSGLIWASSTMQHINEYSWWMVLYRIIFNPIGFHLWFLRTLFIFILAYPVIKWIATKQKYNNIFFAIVGVMWLLEINILPIGNESLLFFSFGIFTAQCNLNITTPHSKMKPFLLVAVFVFSTIIKTFLAFHHLPVIGILSQILLHKICIVSGLLLAWFYSNKIVTWSFTQKWFVAILPFSFMIYVAHVPIVTYAIEWVFSWANHITNYRLLTYIFLNLTVIVVCILIGMLLKMISPKVYSLLTGGRGIN